MFYFSMVLICIRWSTNECYPELGCLSYWQPRLVCIRWFLWPELAIPTPLSNIQNSRILPTAAPYSLTSCHQGQCLSKAPCSGGHVSGKETAFSKSIHILDHLCNRHPAIRQVFSNNTRASMVLQDCHPKPSFTHSAIHLTQKVFLLVVHPYT